MQFDLVAHLTRQMVFSKAAFGPGARTQGVIDHIRKELKEVEESGGEASEWVDVVILALDGLTRQLWNAGIHQRPADEIAEMAVGMVRAKQARNELRDWPDWRTADPNRAIEHVRSKDAPPV
jgi:hypothetical protein